MNQMKLRRNNQGMAMATAILGVALFMGLIVGWYVTSQTNREFTIADKDRKLLTQVAMTTSDVVKAKLVNYLQTLTQNYNPANPQSIGTVTMQQLGYAARNTESIQIQCIGQGQLNLSQTGAPLQPCTNSNGIFPKIFSISVNVRSENGGVVASLLETAELGPSSFNDIGYFISGESQSSQINFAGGVYEGMVAAFFDDPQPTDTIGFINPTGVPLVFNGILMSNLTKDQIVKGVQLSNGNRSSVGDIQLNKGFLSLAQPTLGIDINQFRASNKFTIVDPPAIANGVIADKVTVELGGLNDSDRCKVRITEDRVPNCDALSQDIIASHCPNFVSSDAKAVTYVQSAPIAEKTCTIMADLTVDTRNIVSMEIDACTATTLSTTTKLDAEGCANAIMTEVNQKVQFNGQYFEGWDGKAWVRIADNVVQKYCNLDLSTVVTNPVISTEACAAIIKETYKVDVGYDKNGRILACNPTRSTATYPGATPVTAPANTVYVIRGKEVEFRPINNSGDFMTVCENITFYVERSSSVKLMTSILRTHAAGGLDWKSPTFRPSEPKANMAIIATQGDIALTPETRSTEQSKTLSTLKAANTPASVKSLVLETTLFATDGSPLFVPSTLRDPASSGTMGTLEVYGSLMGANSANTRSVNYLGNTASVSGFSYVNLVYNKSNLIAPAPILGESASGLALQATTTSFQLNFANVNEAMAYLN